MKSSLAPLTMLANSGGGDAEYPPEAENGSGLLGGLLCPCPFPWPWAQESPLFPSSRVYPPGAPPLLRSLGWNLLGSPPRDPSRGSSEPPMGRRSLAVASSPPPPPLPLVPLPSLRSLSQGAMAPELN